VTAAMTTAEAFAAHRGELLGLAYRMTGTLADAEDIVQEAFVRFDAHADDVGHPRAFLHQVVTRLCLDLLKSARHRREVYPGPWLPEPIVEPLDGAGPSSSELTVGLLLAFERLSPLERAVFILREAFDHDYETIGELLGRSAAACRQLGTRARAHLRDQRPRYTPSRERCERVLGALMMATATGDTDALMGLLEEDVVLLSDGGGKAKAALRPVVGADRVTRFLVGVYRKHPPEAGARIQLARVSGLPGVVVLVGDRCVQTLSVELRGDRIAALYTVRNPDKLRRVRLAAASDPARG